MDLLVKNVQLNGEKVDIGIDNGVIVEIGSITENQGDTDIGSVIDGSDKIATQGLYNGHSHAAMTLFRGYGDDMPLQEWLEEKIWPLEENLTPDDVYWGTRLACLEMIRTGTLFFNDMYWEYDAVVEAVKDSGIRAMLSGVFIDKFDPEMAEEQRKLNQKRFEESHELPDRIQFALGPHAIYTVSRESLTWIAEFSRRHDLPVHIHLSETQREVEDCKEENGTTPVRYLDEIGLLHDGVVAAHVIWVDDEELDILADRGVSVVYNPTSNLKLNSGLDFPYLEMKSRGIDVCLGTDGAASNNNLNMLEEIKLAAILQKTLRDDTTTLPAKEAYEMGTTVAAGVFNVPVPEFETGDPADLILLDKNHPSMRPLHDLHSQITYSIDPEAITGMICDGEAIMEDRTVKQEGEIYECVNETVERLTQTS